MYASNRIVKIIAVIVVILLLICGALYFLNKEDDAPKNSMNVPTPNEILYGIRYIGDLNYDFDILKNSFSQVDFYSDYTIQEEYSMIYQITDKDEETQTKNFLGIIGDVPKTDYEKEYLLLSVGRRIQDIDDKLNKVDDNGLTVLDIIYVDEDYSYGKIFVYRMNTKKISSGISYEKYLWDNAIPNDNFIYNDSSANELIDQGKYYTIYKRKDNKYIYYLFDDTGENEQRRTISDVPVEIEEYGETIIKITKDGKSMYYNPQKDLFSMDEYDFQTNYLIYNIITYMRIKDGQIQLILRNAYDKSLYAKIVRLQFTNDTNNIDSLVENVEVVDDTHIRVKYYKGDKRELVTEIVEVYDLRR